METTKEPDEELKEEKSFSYCFVKKKKKEEPIDYMSIFGKLKVTRPCLQAVTLPPFNKYIKEFTARKTREKEKIVIGGSTSAMVQKKLPPKKSDPGWCDLTSSQMPADQDIEEAIKDFCQKSKFAGATEAHQLAEKKAERKQWLKRASRRIIGRMIEKKKGPSKVSDYVEISSMEDKTPRNKKKSKATNAGQEDSGPPTKPEADPKHATTKSETTVVTRHPSSTPTGQVGGSLQNLGRTRLQLLPSKYRRPTSTIHLPPLLPRKKHQHQKLTYRNSKTKREDKTKKERGKTMGQQSKRRRPRSPG